MFLCLFLDFDCEPVPEIVLAVVALVRGQTRQKVGKAAVVEILLLGVPQVSPVHFHSQLAVAAVSTRMDLLPSLVVLTGLQEWKNSRVVADLSSSRGGRRCFPVGYFEAAAAVVSYQDSQIYRPGIQAVVLMSLEGLDCQM